MRAFFVLAGPITPRRARRFNAVEPRSSRDGRHLKMSYYRPTWLGAGMKRTAVVQWNDLFVIVDDGTLQLDEYRRLEGLVKIQSAKFLSGLGCLVILPPGAKPPPEEIRKYINSLLERLGSALRCLCYAVEGTGFRSAA